jgi:transposase
LIQELIEKECPYQGGAKIKLEEYREILNAIYYINKTGVQWAYLPHDFPPYTTVNYHYMKFVKSGLFERINDHLREVARETSALKKMPRQV